MMSHIFKTAIKNVFNKKNSSLLSMLGLTIAFLSIFYIYSYVSFELGYDSIHKNADRIYRVSGDIIATEDTMSHALLGPLMGPGLKQEFPEVQEFTRLTPFKQAILLENNEEKFTVEEAYMTDQSVFDVFSIEFIFGNKENALVAPDQIVINQSLSKKLFGDDNPVDKTLIFNEKLLTIKGVIKDSPGNVHHKLNVLFSQPDFDSNDLNDENQSEGYWMPSTYTFILLNDNCNITAITENFDPFFNKYMASFGKQINSKFNPIAIPLKDLHFSKHMSYDYPKGNKSYTYILIFVALFIIIIALLNYGNLIIFHSVINSKDIGIKKIFGASKFNLFLQFLINSLIFISLSVVFALIAFKLTLPYSETITGINPEDFVKGYGIFTLSALLVLFASISSSTIPFINQYRKKGLLLINSKNTSSFNIKGLKLGKSVAIIQFSLSIVLIIASITISKQLSFLINSDMGFDKNNVVLLKLPAEQTNLSKANAFKDELNSSSFISNTAISSHTLGDVLGSVHFQLNVEGETVTKIVNSMYIDYDFIPLMGIKLKEGRNFNPDFKSDSKQSVIVNDAFIDYCGLDYNIVGSEMNGAKIIGVLENICFNSLHTDAEPILFLLNDNAKGYINIKLKTSKVDEAINSIKNSWLTFFPDVPFEYQFLDQRVEMLYENDLKKQTIIRLFTLVSFILSLMGFLNLAANINKQKTKEIAIRKVNGATISETLIMLNKDFIKLVSIAFIIATPIAYYAMSKWLDGFANRIELSWLIFAFSGFIAMFIAITTASWLTYRAARRNPIESLKYE
jgi:putative ABC transport system permease protein